VNGIFIYLALREIKKELINKFIKQVWIRERLIQIEFDENAFFVSLYPEALGFYISKKIGKFEKLSYFDEHISNTRIVKVEQTDHSPVLDLYLERIEYGQRKTSKIRLSFYKEAPNLSLILEDGQRNLFARYIEKTIKSSVFNLTWEELKDKDLLVKNFEGFDKCLAHELNIENLEKLKAIINGAPYKPKIVSIIPLRVSLFASDFINEFDSWNELFKEGINSYIERKERISSERERNKKIKRIEEKIERLKKELADKEVIEFNRIAGELILMNIPKIKKGMDKIILYNPYTQKNLEIGLDPVKDAHKNAEDYFKRYKKLKRGIPKLQEMIKKLEKEIELLKSGVGVKKKIIKIAAGKSVKEKKSLPFREFILDSNSRIYVGKDAHSNMELTFKFAQPDDYFFHIRGYEGAHTILRPVLKKGQNVRKEDIEKAAAVAAYFSKAKNQKNVPVSYTQRKYLKKSKKGKLGTVVLMRESVIFVDPGLPSDTKD